MAAEAEPTKKRSREETEEETEEDTEEKHENKKQKREFVDVQMYGPYSGAGMWCIGLSKFFWRAIGDSKKSISIGPVEKTSGKGERKNEVLYTIRVTNPPQELLPTLEKHEDEEMPLTAEEYIIVAANAVPRHLFKELSPDQLEYLANVEMQLQGGQSSWENYAVLYFQRLRYQVSKALDRVEELEETNLQSKWNKTLTDHLTWLNQKAIPAAEKWKSKGKWEPNDMLPNMSE